MNTKKNVVAKEFLVALYHSPMNVIQFGTGKRQMVMIAGVSLTGLEGQGQSVADAFADFGKEFTVTLLERKKVLPVGWRVEDMAEDVYQVLTRLGVKNACVYGASQGGMIAMVLAARHPELVERLVLCSSQWQATEKMKENALRWKELAAKKDVVALNRFFFERVYSQQFLDSVRELLPQLEQQGSPEDCRRMEVLADACIAYQGIGDPGRITCPVMVFAGAEDAVIGVEGSEEIARQLGCPLVAFPGGSHAVYDENPDFKAQMLRFFVG